MKYFYYESNMDIAIDCWNNSQFELCDIVLSLTDNRIYTGSKIYALFCRNEILNLMQYFICDFGRIKKELGIIGDYVERIGDIYSKNFNPRRNRRVLTLAISEMEKRAMLIYNNIMLDLQYIAKTKLKNLTN